MSSQSRGSRWPWLLVPIVVLVAAIALMAVFCPRGVACVWRSGLFLLAALWGNPSDAPVQGVMNGMVALVVALLAICVTMHTFLFAELSGREHDHPGEREVCREIQGERVRRLIRLSLLSAAAFLACYCSISVYEASSRGCEASSLALCTAVLVLSLFLSGDMVEFCVRSARYKVYFGAKAEAKMAETLGEWQRASEGLPPIADEGEPRRGVGWHESGSPSWVDSLVRNLSGSASLPPSEVPDRFADYARAQRVLCGNSACEGYWDSLDSSVGCFYRFAVMHDAFDVFASGGRSAHPPLWPRQVRGGRSSSTRGAGGYLPDSGEEEALALTMRLWFALTRGAGGSYPLAGCQVRDASFGRAALGGAVLKGASVRDCSLAGANLSASITSGAAFENCDFSGTKLDGANLEACSFGLCELTRMLLNGKRGAADSIALSPESRLEGCRFVNCTLAEALLESDVQKASDGTLPRPLGTDPGPYFSLRDTSLRNSTMRDSALRGILLDRCSWVDSSLSHIRFERCLARHSSFAGSSFSGGLIETFDASGSRFSSASFDNVRLVDFRCKGGVFAGASFVFAEVEGCELRHCDMDGSSFASCSVHGLSLRASRAGRVAFTDTRLADCDFDLVRASLLFSGGCEVLDSHFGHAELARSDFREASLVDCDFEGARLSCSAFPHADIRGVRFEGARLDGASFLGATIGWWTGFLDCDISGCDFGGCDMENVLFADVDLGDVRFKGASLVACRFERPRGISSLTFAGAKLAEVLVEVSSEGEREELEAVLKDVPGISIRVGRQP